MPALVEFLKPRLAQDGIVLQENTAASEFAASLLKIFARLQEEKGYRGQFLLRLV